jgi:hypothetical protein
MILLGTVSGLRFHSGWTDDAVGGVYEGERLSG